VLFIMHTNLVRVIVFCYELTNGNEGIGESFDLLIFFRNGLTTFLESG
jgi:hypothetical protein